MTFWSPEFRNGVKNRNRNQDFLFVVRTPGKNQQYTVRYDVMVKPRVVDPDPVDP